MAAPTDYYVDPAIAADSGTGTIGDPYGDLQYALNTITRNATSGDRVNVKAGTAEVLDGTGLTLSTYGTPGLGSPLIIQGYTTAAGDGGVGVINCNSGKSFVAAYSYIKLSDLTIYGSGAQRLIQLTNYIGLFNCTFHTSTASLALSLGTYNQMHNCEVYNCSGIGLYSGTGSTISRCYFHNGTTYSFSTVAIQQTSVTGSVNRCIISVSGACGGIQYQGPGTIEHNSIYSTGGTGKGITNYSTASTGISIRNNLIEGFSGSGGFGISCPATHVVDHFNGNAVYNCETAYSGPARYLRGGTDNEVLTASPFVSASTGDFTPVATGNVKEGALPAKIGKY